MALAILSVGQQFTILTSTLFTALPIAAVLAYFLPSISRYLSPETNPKRSWKVAGTQGALLALCVPLIFMAVPTLFIVVAFAGLILFILISLIQLVLRKMNKEPKRLPKILRNLFLWGVTLSVLSMVIFITWRPWVPSEKIAVKSGAETRTVYGYVIGTQGKQTMVVNMKQTDITWIGEDDLGERTICTAPTGLREWYWQPPFAFFATEKAARQECGV
ncbi:hypothetical protein LN996_02590 [Arthrobacter sp. AK01]|uniref:hypothetical protein n=1 Tax=Arthrobacter sp. AK01 TaxID=2894084 RepID=UPI001E5822F2|nr:hypothetical protein [Arthrobacter sp. AK01]MCD4849694.1 hypothetical protein [Arthrobacter sp. AK01]